MLTEKAIGKIILSGEHAVVHGIPAIALPVFNCQASTTISDDISKISNLIIIKAPQLSKTFNLKTFTEKDGYNPLELTVINFIKNFNLKDFNNLSLEIFSEIPIAAGMGSGAAISTSIIKALASYFKISMSKEEIYNQVYEIEKIYHGNPSGIDPKVIVFEKPYYFIRNVKMEVIDINTCFAIAIIDSGIKSSTKEVVEWVGQQKEKFPEKYNSLFSKIGEITENIKTALFTGELDKIGILMNKNQQFLKELGISNKILDKIAEDSLKAGALGSKLSGAGWGGIVISLLEKEQVKQFDIKMKSLGYKDIIYTYF